MSKSSPARTLLFGLPAVATALGGVFLVGAFVAFYAGPDLDPNLVAILAGGVALAAAMGLPLFLAGRLIARIGSERVHVSAVRGTILALWNAALIGGLVAAVPGPTADALRSGSTWLPGSAVTPLPMLAGLVADQLSSPSDAIDVPAVAPASTPTPTPTPVAVPEVGESAVTIEVDGETVLTASELFERRADGVVVVKVRATVQEGNPLAELFERMGATTREGHGSGFVVGPGLIVTNQHVIDQAEEVAVVTRDGRTLGPVKSLVIDAEHDLALLQVDDLNLPTVRLAGADPVPSVGADTFAIGAPLGLSYSLTRGIVSAHRNVQGTDFLQMQTTVAPGSSGGPLFDDHGRVIAVNTATRYPGLNLAVQVRYVHALLDAPREARVYAVWTPSLVVESLTVEGLELRPTDRESLANVMLQAGSVAIDCAETLPEPARVALRTGFEIAAELEVTGNLDDEALQCVSDRLEFVGFALRLTAGQLGVTTPVTLMAVVRNDRTRLEVEVELRPPSPPTAADPAAESEDQTPNGSDGQMGVMSNQP